MGEGLFRMGDRLLLACPSLDGEPLPLNEDSLLLMGDRPLSAKDCSLIKGDCSLLGAVWPLLEKRPFSMGG